MPVSASGSARITARTNTSTRCAAARRRSAKTMGVAAAEAFVQHRGHSYPRNDILVELLGAKRG